MTATERIREMLEKKRVENVGASGWYHTPECDRKDAQSFAKRLVEITDYNRWDFIKIMNTGVYMQEAHGADLEFFSENISLERLRSKMIFEFHSYLVNNVDDMRNFHAINARENPVFLREAAHVKALADHYKGSIPILPTIFLPAHTIPEFVGGIPAAKVYFDEHPDAVDSMLKALFETEKQLLDMYIEAGADGFFFANRWASKDTITEQQFDRFCVPYETALIDYVSDRTWFNMIHVHGEKNFFWKQFMDYKVQAFNWENVPHKVPEEGRDTVAKIRDMTDRILVTGTDQFADFYGSEQEVLERFDQRIELAAKQSGDNRLIFAPGCSLPLDIDPENVHQLRVAADRYNCRRK